MAYFIEKFKYWPFFVCIWINTNGESWTGSQSLEYAHTHTKVVKRINSGWVHVYVESKWIEKFSISTYLFIKRVEHLDMYLFIFKGVDLKITYQPN